jgi:hypothetical protein
MKNKITLKSSINYLSSSCHDEYYIDIIVPLYIVNFC